MKFLKLIWGREQERRPPDPNRLSTEEIRLTLTKYDRVLAELNEALAASQGKPDARWRSDVP